MSVLNCYFGLSIIKCLEMGCKNYFDQLQSLLSLSSAYTEGHLETGSQEELITWESIFQDTLNSLQQFHILHPDGPLFLHDENGYVRILQDNFFLTVCAWCRKPIEIDHLEDGHCEGVVSHGICLGCFQKIIKDCARP